MKLPFSAPLLCSLGACLISAVQARPHNVTDTPAPHLPRATAPERTVTWVLDIMNDPTPNVPFPGFGPQLYPTHSSLFFSATELDRPFRLELVDNLDSMRGFEIGQTPEADVHKLVIRGTAINSDPVFRTLRPDGEPGMRRATHRFAQPVRATNADLLDPRSGLGIALDTWHRSNLAARQAAPPAQRFVESNSFVRNVLSHPGLFGPTFTVPDTIRSAVQRGEEWSRFEYSFATRVRHPVQSLFYEAEDSRYLFTAVDRVEFTLDPTSPPQTPLPEPKVMDFITWAQSYADEWSYLAPRERVSAAIRMLPVPVNAPSGWARMGTN